MQQSLVAGIDIGGTNVVVGLVNRSGDIVWKENFSTRQFNEFDRLVEKTCSVINDTLKSNPDWTLVGCGVGAPNGNFYTGNIEHAPNLTWKGIVPVAEKFQLVLGVNTIITNDANAAALGEMFYGAAKECKDFIFITLGTGLGSGIVVNGQLVYGHDGFAGELGHVIINPNGRPCGCDRRGCLETYCSALGISTTYRELTHTNTTIEALEIFEKAMTGEAAAIKAFSITGETLGLALANAVAYTSPQAIFLFGGLAQAGDLLLKPTQESFEKNIHVIYKNKVSIRLSALNENDGAVLGAASLIWNNYV